MIAFVKNKLEMWNFISQMQETSVGHALDEDRFGEAYTIFVPSNEALENMKDGTLDYLRSPEVLWIPMSVMIVSQHGCPSLWLPQCVSL